MELALGAMRPPTRSPAGLSCREPAAAAQASKSTRPPAPINFVPAASSSAVMRRSSRRAPPVPTGEHRSQGLAPAQPERCVDVLCRRAALAPPAPATITGQPCFPAEWSARVPPKPRTHHNSSDFPGSCDSGSCHSRPATGPPPQRCTRRPAALACRRPAKEFRTAAHRVRTTALRRARTKASAASGAQWAADGGRQSAATRRDDIPGSCIARPGDGRGRSRTRP